MSQNNLLWIRFSVRFNFLCRKVIEVCRIHTLLKKKKKISEIDKQWFSLLFSCTICWISVGFKLRLSCANLNRSSRKEIWEMYLGITRYFSKSILMLWMSIMYDRLTRWLINCLKSNELENERINLMISFYRAARWEFWVHFCVPDIQLFTVIEWMVSGAFSLAFCWYTHAGWCLWCIIMVRANLSDVNEKWVHNKNKSFLFSSWLIVIKKFDFVRLRLVTYWMLMVLWFQTFETSKGDLSRQSAIVCHSSWTSSGDSKKHFLSYCSTSSIS